MHRYALPLLFHPMLSMWILPGAIALDAGHFLWSTCMHMPGCCFLCIAVFLEASLSIGFRLCNGERFPGS